MSEKFQGRFCVLDITIGNLLELDKIQNAKLLGKTTISNNADSK